MHYNDLAVLHLLIAFLFPVYPTLNSAAIVRAPVCKQRDFHYPSAFRSAAKFFDT